MFKRVFVTGTDTGVGKTVVSTILAKALSARYWKPVQTGSVEGRDSDFVARWMGADQIDPEAFCLAPALSPHAAAEIENRPIWVRDILDRAPRHTQPLVIEGAGGVLVPFNDQEQMTDLIEALEAPVLLVARSSLGTINHTLLTLEALRRRDLSICGIVMVGDLNPKNRRAIEQRSGLRVWAEIPFCQNFTPDWFAESVRQIKEGGLNAT